MKRGMILISGLVLFSLAIFLLPGPAAPIKEEKSPPSKFELARLKVVRDASPRFVLNKKSGSLVDLLETNYLWSKRLLEAEREVARDKRQVVAACKGHFDRMVELEAKVMKLLWEQSKGGRIPYYGCQLQHRAAVVFYRAEAELWLERAKSRQ